MPPEVVAQSEQFRMQLDAHDASQATRMARAWGDATRSLEGEYERVAQEIGDLRARGLPVSRWHITRMERYQSLLRQIDAKQRELAPVMVNEIDSAQATLARLGLEHSQAALDFIAPGIVGQFDRPITQPAAPVRVLAYGIQPRTTATPALMTPKRRYLEFHDVVGRSWLRFGLTASDQLQCALGREELVTAVNAVNAVSGATIALSANSGVYGGRIGAFASGREGLMRGMVPEPHRHGSVPRAFADELDYVRWVAGFTCLVLPDGRGGFRRPGIPYRELAAREGPVFEDFSYHEHYLWPSARPRSRLGTLEVRPACQQPGASMSVCALSLGIVEARERVKEFVTQIGWPALLAHRRHAVQLGMAASEPIPGYLATVLDLADEGLRSRGLGEELYLAELRERVDRRSGAADEAREHLRRGGMAALLEATSLERPYGRGPLRIALTGRSRSRPKVEAGPYDAPR